MYKQINAVKMLTLSDIDKITIFSSKKHWALCVRKGKQFVQLKKFLLKRHAQIMMSS